MNEPLTDEELNGCALAYDRLSALNVSAYVDADALSAADKLQRMAVELQHHRAAKRADSKRVRQVVQLIAMQEIQLGLGEYTPDCLTSIADTIASRVASQLAGSVGVGLSSSDRGDLYYLVGWCHSCAGDVLVGRDKYDRALAVLERLLDAPDLLAAIRSVLDNDDLPAGQLRAELRRIVGGK